MTAVNFKNIVLLLMNQEFVEKFRHLVKEKYGENKWPSPKECGAMAKEVINNIFEGK